MLKKLLIAFAIGIAIFLVIVALQPSDYRVTRSTTITAPVATVFNQVNDFHKWEAWSPWAKLDPAAKNSFTGAPAGSGAVFDWSGNEKIGEGSMTILESRPNELIRIKLDFVKPFASTATAEFAFQSAGNQTMVTWSMLGKNNFMGKAICLFMNMDKMLGGEFEKGLTAMKSVSEGAAKN